MDRVRWCCSAARGGQDVESESCQLVRMGALSVLLPCCPCLSSVSCCGDFVQPFVAVSQRCLFIVEQTLGAGQLCLSGQDNIILLAGHHTQCFHVFLLCPVILSFKPFTSSAFWQSVSETFGGFAVVLKGSCSLTVDSLVLGRNFL